jgi:Domain of unknown function (DUF3859)
LQVLRARESPLRAWLTKGAKLGFIVAEQRVVFGMNAHFQRLSAAVFVVLTGLAALADPAPPEARPGIEIAEYGIHCNVETEGTQAAPETASGFINLLSGMPEFAFRQQQVPARLGISFGVVVVSDTDILNVRLLSWRPRAARPDVWYKDIIAAEPSIQGFMFETADELVTGTWTFEGYDGETRLYSVEFDVVPGSELPGVTSDCNLLS